MIWRLVFKRGKILSAGRLNKKSLGIVMLLSVGLLWRAVRVANHPIQERIPAPFTP